MQRSNSEPEPQPQNTESEEKVVHLRRKTLPRPTSSGFLSFLRWFRRDERDLNGSDSEDENLSRPVSPLFSSSESVNSVHSTATATSFKYVSPAVYKPFGLASQPETLIAPGPDTETYRRRLKQRERLRELDRNLTLRKKYRLFAADTLKHDDRVDHSEVDTKKTKVEDQTELNNKYSDLSLPIRQTDYKVSVNGKRCHRRTASDSSKDKKAGAYVHVKGKRRAPPPPIKGTDHKKSVNSFDHNTSQSKTSTLSRKKRQAPPPPTNNTSNGKMEFSENMSNPKRPSVSPKPIDEGVSNDSLKLEEGVLKPAKSTIIKEDMSFGKEVKDVPPVSPRPWYKRTGNNGKEFKKDKTLEKSKDKENFPDVNYYRNSTSPDYNPRFSFFSKMNDKSDDRKKDGEKRKSGLSMLANISELDREAAAIINSQREQNPNEDFDEMPNFLRPHVAEKDVFEESSPKSARDLISKFNAITKAPKVTVNSAFFNPKESAKLFQKCPKKPANTYFLQNSDLVNTPTNIQETETPPMKRSIFSTSGFSKPNSLTSIDDIETKPTNDLPKFINGAPKEIINDNLNTEQSKKFPMKSASTVSLNSSINWTCKHCNSQNPHFKTICTSCNTAKNSCNENRLNVKSTDSPKSPKRTLGDWEKELKKYFPTKTRNSMCDLKKSSSDKSVFKKLAYDDKKNKVNNLNVPSNDRYLKVNNDVQLNKPLVNPNMEEVRKIRLERFSANFDNINHSEDNMLEQSVLFERLREMKNSLPKQHPNDLPKINISPAEEPKIINRPSDELLKRPVENDKITNDDEKDSAGGRRRFGAIKKSKTVSDMIDLENQQPEMSVYVVTTHTEFDDIKVRNENANKPLKVSSSCQTSGVLRQLEPSIKPSATQRHETVVPVAPDNIKAPELKIRNRTYELIRPRDFISMKNSKINPIYVEPKSSYPNIPKSAIVDHGLNNIIKHTDFNKLTSHDNSVEINKLLKSLEKAIAEGRQMEAASLAKDLANLKVNCQVIRQQNAAQASNINSPVIVTLDLYVEDQLTHQGPILLQVPKCITLLGLKRKILHDFEIPIAIQRWILGSQLASDDTKTLEEYGIRESSTAIYLYLVAPEGEGESISGENKIIVSGPSLIQTDMKRNYSLLSDIKEMDSRSESDISQLDFDVSEYSCNGLPEDLVSPDVKTKQNWICPTCTVKNVNFNENCTVCNSAKPLENNTRQLESLKDEHYMQLLNLDSKDIVSNLEPFVCSVCFDNFVIGEGVVLRECLHTFCRECLTNTIKYSEEPEVKCPFRNEQYACNYVLQEREIKALVSKEIYEQHLAKSIAQAENKIENAFHCKTPNCLGWCIFEDNVNLFHCPVCAKNNCLTCQAIHTNLNCKQYQEKMKEDSETNADAKRTKDMLRELVDKGEAMTCPTCQVILMKKWGCDWLKCSMCKTEICWVTRGPRWGPNGKGDTSAGCRCGIEGRKCHAKCNYCH